MQHPIFKIFEQFDRTRSPIDQTAAWSDARLQAFPPSRNHDCRHRTHAPDQEGAVQNSESFASRTRPRPKSGTQYSPHDPRYVPKHLLAPISDVCTAAIQRRRPLRNVALRATAPSPFGATSPRQAARSEQRKSPTASFSRESLAQVAGPRKALPPRLGGGHG
jgi:hypothetical protein